MPQSSCPAAKLEAAQRMDLAIQTLAKDANLSKLASTNDVSRKYLYQQKGKARDALQEAF